MNENDLGQLVNLLSYLKKHDDVESELSKDRAEGAENFTIRKPPFRYNDMLGQRGAFE